MGKRKESHVFELDVSLQVATWAGRGSIRERMKTVDVRTSTCRTYLLFSFRFSRQGVTV